MHNLGISLSEIKLLKANKKYNHILPTSSNILPYV